MSRVDVLVTGGTGNVGSQALCRHGGCRDRLIDARDVGDALAAAVVSDQFDGSALELSGHRSIGHRMVAAEIGKALGRKVTYVAVPREAAGEAVRAFGLDDWTVKIVVDY